MAMNGHHGNGINGDATPDFTTVEAPEEEDVTREDILANERYFPSFANLPEEDCVNDHRFQMFNGEPAPICTWIFAADIVDMANSTNPRLRNKTIVRDRTRVHYEVVFTHGPDQAELFDFEEIINGRTMCLLCPYKTRFLDQTWGIVVDDLRTVKVIKNSLRSLTLLSYDRSLGRRCETCKKANPKLMCKHCKATFYCGRYCKLIDEKSFHVIRCNAVKEFVRLYDINFDIYVKNLGFRPNEPLDLPPSRAFLDQMEETEP